MTILCNPPTTTDKERAALSQSDGRLNVSLQRACLLRVRQRLIGGAALAGWVESRNPFVCEGGCVLEGRGGQRVQAGPGMHEKGAPLANWLGGRAGPVAKGGPLASRAQFNGTGRRWAMGWIGKAMGNPKISCERARRKCGRKRVTHFWQDRPALAASGPSSAPSARRASPPS